MLKSKTSKYTNKKKMSPKLQKKVTSRPKTSLHEDNLYGIHTVREALKNTSRRLVSLNATPNALKELKKDIILAQKNGLKLITNTNSAEITKDLSQIYKGHDIVHQGAHLRAHPLSPPSIIEVTKQKKPIILLDQITDPHNVGAILRIACILETGAVIMTKHNSPKSIGTLAKVASGALEHVPLIKVTNLVRSFEDLTQNGYTVCGLDEAGDADLSTMSLPHPIALVMGAEGAGLRHLTKQKCDKLVQLPIHNNHFSTLNVAMATTIALYEINRKNK